MRYLLDRRRRRTHPDTEGLMPMDLEHFVHIRPLLYHLTARANLERIKSSATLQPAADLLGHAGEEALVRTKRAESAVVRVNGSRVHIRDQQPLHEGNIAFATGWQFQDFVKHLNEHVFFWPGTPTGPISYGVRHFQRYHEEDNVVLVVETEEVLKMAGNPPICFCRYNSGSPRWSGGRPSPRGPQTFQRAGVFDGSPSRVVEVVFRGPVKLPQGGLRVTSPSEFVS